MSLTVSILGCGSASPTPYHMPACQVVDHNSRLFMVDCGEGAQLSLQRAGLKASRLAHIFISHLHGDHVLGLPGLLSTMSLHDFGGEMHVYMHPLGIDIIKRCLDVFSHPPTYTLIFHPLEMANKVVYEDDSLEVSTFPLNHGIPAVGFKFQEKPKLRHINGEMVEFYKVPIWQRAAIKAGADFIAEDGRVIPNKVLTTDPDPSVSYAYASDTVPSNKVIEAVRGVDLLYHESTYGDDNATNARLRGHSTARQAAEVALKAGAKQLLIGHYSKSYAGNEEVLLKQAQEVFPDTIMAREGMKIQVR